MELILQAIKKMIKKNDKRMTEVQNTAQHIYEELSPIFLRVDSLDNPLSFCIGKLSSAPASYDELLEVVETAENGTPLYLYDSVTCDIARAVYFNGSEQTIMLGWVYVFVNGAEYTSELRHLVIYQDTYSV